MIMNNPFTDKSPAEIQSCFADKHTEKDLADAYAVTSNMFWWTADNIDDYDENTPEYQSACAITDDWAALMDMYQRKIFAYTLVGNGLARSVGNGLCRHRFGLRRGGTKINVERRKDSQDVKSGLPFSRVACILF